MTSALRALWARWDGFWFPEIDLRELAVMRITMGVLLIVWHVALWPDLELLFTSAGPNDLELLRTNWSRFRFGPFDGMEIGTLRWAFLASLTATVAFTAGCGTRLMNFVVVVFLAAWWHRSPWIQNGGDRLIRILCFYLLFTPCGGAWSVDAWARGRLGTLAAKTAPALGVRLIQLQLVVMYVYTGIGKLPGFSWQQGTAVYYSISDVSYARVPVLFDAAMDSPLLRGLTMGLTWTTLVWEVCFGLLVVNRRTRYPALLMGIGLHLGIWATLVVGIFSFASVWGYLAFLYPGWIDRLATRWPFLGRAR